MTYSLRICEDTNYHQVEEQLYRREFRLHKFDKVLPEIQAVRPQEVLGLWRVFLSRHVVDDDVQLVDCELLRYQRGRVSHALQPIPGFWQPASLVEEVELDG